MGTIMAIANTTPMAIVTAIQEAGTDVIGQAGLVVAAAVGVGIAFWAPKALWRFFKGLAK